MLRVDGPSLPYSYAVPTGFVQGNKFESHGEPESSPNVSGVRVSPDSAVVVRAYPQSTTFSDLTFDRLIAAVDPDLRARLGRYWTYVSLPQRVTIAGRPAFTHTLADPRSTSEPFTGGETYYVYDVRWLVTVHCFWDEAHRDVVRTGCMRVLHTLTIKRRAPAPVPAAGV
jgi:hypothetical protein